MADEKQLEILKSGTNNWNQWRDENVYITIDLETADLRNADLTNANLRKAYLSDADLRNSNLRNADLTNANLRNANLRYIDLEKADLSYAYLSDADLSYAYLRNANLRKADLGNADLTNANLWNIDLENADLRNVVLRNSNLRNADLNHAFLKDADLRNVDLQHVNLFNAILTNANFENMILGGTYFGFNDLSHVQNLDKVKHTSPSALDIHTIIQSKGIIPEVFLRGVGADDQMISYVKGLQGAIQFYSCFISYSHKDEEFAKRMFDKLQGQNIRCWLASEDLKTGDKFRDSINEAIRIHDKLLLILSKESVQSEWVESEVLNALDNEKKYKKEHQQEKLVLFPIRIDNAVMEHDSFWVNDLRNKRHITDFSKWRDQDEFEKSYSRIVRDLQASEEVYKEE